MCFFSPKQKFLLSFTRTEAIHQERSWSSSALQHPHSSVWHEEVNLGCSWTQHLLSQLTAQPVSIPEHWTTAQLLEEVAPGHCQEEVQGWASLPAPCPLFALLLCKGYSLLKSTARSCWAVILCRDPSIYGTHHTDTAVLGKWHS